MANLTVKNAAGSTVEIKATGDGSSGDPFVTEQKITATSAIPVSDNGGSITVDAPVSTPVFVRLSDGSSAIATLPISAASLPLPSGAATAAKQPALGTAGTAASDVITIQGIASMTPISNNITQIGGSTQSATNPLFVRLTDGSAAITNLPTNLVNISGSAQSSTNPLFVRPSISVVRIPCNQLARPLDTTAYIANDSISNSTSSPVARTFTGAASVNGGSGEIVRAFMKCSDHVFTGSVRLYLMNGNSAPTAVNDNSPYNTYTDLQTNCLGYVDFAATQSGRLSEGLLSSGSTMPFTCGGSTTSLFGQVMCLQAFTPTSGMTFDFEIWVVDRN